MMNMFELNERLKDFSKDQLMQEMQAPSGLAPQFMVLSELQRRTRMEQAMMADGQGAPQTTVAEDAVAAAGVPQGGLADMARALAPKTDMTENTGVAPVTAMQEGGLVGDPAIRLQARRMGMSPEEYLESLGPAQRRMEEARVMRSRMLGMEPRGDGATFPSQEDLDRSAQEEALGMRASRALTAPSETGGLADIPANIEAVDRPPALDLPRGPRGFSPLSFDTVEALDAELGAQGLPSVPLNAIEEMYLRENRSGPPRRAVPPTPLEYGPPRRRPPVEPEPSDNPMLRFEENFDYQGAPARAPSLPAVSPEGLQETIDAGRAPANPMLEFQENFDYQGAPTFGPPPGPGSNKGTPRTTDTPNLLPPTTTPTAAPAAPGAGGPAGAGGPGAGAPASNLDRMFEQDKWLSLARFGMALMSSQAPTFGQALGEAGTVGLDALSGARSDYLERKQAADIMALRRAAAAGGGRGSAAAGPDFGLSPDTARLLDQRRDDLQLVEAQLAMAGYIPGTDVPPALVPLVRQRENVLSDIQDIQNIGSGGALSALQAFRGQPGASGPVYDLTE